VKLVWSNEAWDDYLHWQRNDPKVFIRLNALIKAIEQSPFKGPGKPEALPLRMVVEAHHRRASIGLSR
jgi:toxin YoeB